MRIAGLHHACFQHPGKNPFPGHDAVAHQFPDGAALWQVLPIWVISNSTSAPTVSRLPTGRCITSSPSTVRFSAKSPGLTCARGHHLVDAGPGQQAHLADAPFGMGIARQAVVHQKLRLVDVMLDHALAVADGDGEDAALGSRVFWCLGFMTRRVAQDAKNSSLTGLGEGV